VENSIELIYITKLPEFLPRLTSFTFIFLIRNTTLSLVLLQINISDDLFKLEDLPIFQRVMHVFIEAGL
jgi:hypothetical protein